MGLETPHPAALLEASERKVEALRRTLFTLKALIDGLTMCAPHEVHECISVLQRSEAYSIAARMGLEPDG